MMQDAADRPDRTVARLFLDPFLGSGSTLNRRREYRGGLCCGIELDPLYVDVIIRRYEAEKRALPLFSPTLARPSKR